MTSRTPVGILVALVATTACGGNDLFAVQTAPNEAVLDRAATTWVASGELTFEDIVVVGDLDGDGIADAMVRPMFDVPDGNQDTLRDANAVYVLYGGTTTGEIRLDALPSLYDVGSTPLFPTIRPVGDIDGDGLADVVITFENAFSCPPFHDANDPSVEHHGGAFLVYGSPTRLRGARQAGEAAVFLRDPVPCRSVAAAPTLGDLDGDGKDDFALDSNDNVTLDNTQKLLVFYGKTARLSGTVDILATADAVLVSPPGAPRLEIAGAGDVDGDGKGDLFLRRAADLDDSQVDLRLVRGSATRLGGTVTADDLPHTRFVSDSLGAGLPTPPTTTALGDLDGDGVDDFALLGSSPGYPRIYPGGPRSQRIFYGRRGGFPAQVDANAPDASLAASAQTETVLASGDVDGDGIPDLVMSDVARHDRDGAVFVLTGSHTRLSGPIDPAAAGRVFAGSRQRLRKCAPNDAFNCIAHEDLGTHLGVGDLTGDGRADVFVSAPWYSFPEANALWDYGPPLSRGYILSLPAAKP